ncbi:hypothetical protein K458DRAFT_363048 [Lentithecium fluviatile CBS 122367]|uniref:Uncharacterized protein n=1 Tax=Lentithecium fluviatile CBS 122367 TaxID=1168545 RepID=A0A6G1J9B7_9PLEO|nr:hypothetical protein K458DRAFT_363048 [Lentithecium fluviatile CBS 122367]
MDDDQVSILSSPERQQSQYQPYRPAHLRKSTSESSSTERPPSWMVSPVALQQAIPPEQPAARPLPSPLPHMESTLFGNRAVLDTPYQEPVAWANSTYFRSTSQEVPKPDFRSSTFVIREESLPRDSRRYFRHPRHILEAWKPGFWLRFPWWGFGALLLILISSDGTSMEHWRFGNDNAQPLVYISVFEMAMNFLILFALADGAAIRFWRQLLQGTTLSRTHDTYESAHLWPALKRLVGLRFNTVALACVFAALSFVRGPLFQRALTLDSVPVSGHHKQATYCTSPTLVALGVLLSVLGIGGIIPLYNGFWELGRKVSLNPLEVARAFGAPMLEGLDGNATPEMITLERGGMGVRYGALERFGDEKRLRVEETSRATVRVPWRGEIFG